PLACLDEVVGAALEPRRHHPSIRVPDGAQPIPYPGVAPERPVLDQLANAGAVGGFRFHRRLPVHARRPRLRFSGPGGARSSLHDSRGASSSSPAAPRASAATIPRRPPPRAPASWSPISPPPPNLPPRSRRGAAAL